MIPAFALALASSALVLDADSQPLWVAVSLPRAARMHTVDTSELLEILRGLIEPDTDFGVRELDPVELSDCQGSITCMVHRTPSGPFLLVASILGLDDGDRTSLLLVDLEAARRLARDHSDPDEAEAAILDGAVIGGERTVTVRTAEALRAFLARIHAQAYRPAFETRGHWRPFGVLEIAAPAGAVLRVDGRAVALDDHHARVERIRPRTVSVEADHPDYEPFVTTVEITSGAPVRLEVSMIPRPGRYRIERQVAIYGGAGVAAIGAALVIVAAAIDSGTIGCFERCTTELTRFGGGSEDPFENPNGDGPPVAPIGLGVFFAGASTSVTTLLIGDDDDLPWIPIAVGVVAGVVAAGTLLAFRGSSPLE